MLNTRILSKKKKKTTISLLLQLQTLTIPIPKSVSQTNFRIARKYLQQKLLQTTRLIKTKTTICVSRPKNKYQNFNRKVINVQCCILTLKFLIPKKKKKTKTLFALYFTF